MDPIALASLLFAHLDTPQPDKVVFERVAAEIRAALTEAHAACPGCKADEQAFVGQLARHVGVHVLRPDWPQVYRVNDMWLAFASGTGCATAARQLRDRAQPVVEAAVRGIDPSQDFIDEVRQHLFEKLLVRRAERPPRILAYGGKGVIEAWLRVAAVRVAIDLVRRRRGNEESGDDGLLDELDATGDPELAYMRVRYANEVNAALRKAFGTLSPRERTILRLHLLDGLNIDRIGVLYNVHRATVARWIARARETLSDATHRALQDRLGATDSEARSLERLVRSDLHVCLSELLASNSKKEAT